MSEVPLYVTSLRACVLVVFVVDASSAELLNIQHPHGVCWALSTYRSMRCKGSS